MGSLPFGRGGKSSLTPYSSLTPFFYFLLLITKYEGRENRERKKEVLRPGKRI
jgi:hypothetical protein